MNTLRDLLNDLAHDAIKTHEELAKGDHEDLLQAVVDCYLQRFKEENSKYLEWEAR